MGPGSPSWFNRRSGFAEEISVGRQQVDDLIFPIVSGDQGINSTNILSLRLLNQRITGTKFTTAKETVRWMGAMQAQDYPMAKWAVGVRLPGSTDKEVEDAINKGEILRTHLLRPTWHFVSAEDISWMLELTAPRIIASMKFREKWLGLSESIIRKSNRAIEKALSPDRHLTREELVVELDKARIRTDGYRSGHLLMRAELDGLICSGKVRGTKLYGSIDSSSRRQTYALLEKRVPKKRILSREGSLKELAQRYFSSRAPATVQDFARWSGLSMIDAKNGLEMVKSSLVSETIDSKTYWLPNSPPSRKAGFLPPLFLKREGDKGGELDSCSWQDMREHNPVFLLPAFDEFLIAYKDRSAALDHGIEKRLIFENGLFRPAIVINGTVSGIWKRTIDEDELTVETKLFRPHTKKEKIEIQKAAERFGEFLGMKSVVCRI